MPISGFELRAREESPCIFNTRKHGNFRRKYLFCTSAAAVLSFFEVFTRSGCVVDPVFVNMAGLVKAKKYDWKDSNLELFGSDLERNVSRQSPQCDLQPSAAIACIMHLLYFILGEESFCRDGSGVERCWDQGWITNMEDCEV